eukprot:TRINITY_DN15998_c0_g2_i1.p2 TRINITY_DN15998_c0_g2~~TRINITY_DN15998_c0_g2_i1.p2  ORF type:complete len:111 (-),score=14.47 TRINITY_DN15998_c0_g2_i1:382-714(-)
MCIRDRTPKPLFHTTNSPTSQQNNMDNKWDGLKLIKSENKIQPNYDRLMRKIRRFYSWKEEDPYKYFAKKSNSDQYLTFSQRVFMSMIEGINQLELFFLVWHHTCGLCAA